ncbi:MAG: cation transporter [Candidatus Dormibacterales bacterium]
MAELVLRPTALRSGVRLEAATVAWMTAEAILAIGAGLAARSVLLTAFGADSVIELLSGATLLWRLRAEARGGDLERVENAERTGVRIAAGLLAVLCLYVAASSVAGVAFGLHPEASWLGVAVSASALVLMPVLAWRKRLVNRVLNSAALRADIAESACCAYLAGVTLAGVAVATLTGWWWIQYVAALALLWWLVPETREAITAARQGRAHCECD